MRFLWCSDTAQSLAIARRVVQEGHDVRLTIRKSEFHHVGDGLIDKVPWESRRHQWADVIVYDMTSPQLAADAEAAKRKGIPVLGASKLADDLEHDRALGIDFIERIGLESPEFQEFSGARAWKDAAKYLDTLDQDTGAVLKPQGAVRLKTFVACDCHEMHRLLPWFERRFAADKASPKFLLEPCVKGTEISTEAWWTGKDWLLPNHTIERGKLLNGDLGEATGCAGNVVWLTTEREPLFAELFGRLGEEIGDQYRGPMDINAIVLDDGTPMFLEFSPRFGYSAIFGLAELVEDFAEMLAAVASGERWHGQVHRDRYAIGVRTHIPPYPHDEDAGIELSIGYPVEGWEADSESRHLHPAEVQLGEEGVETAGPVPFEVTQTGASIAEARDKLYTTVKQLTIPYLGYRTDIGESGELEDAETLQRMRLVDLPKPPKSEFTFPSRMPLETH